MKTIRATLILLFAALLICGCDRRQSDVTAGATANVPAREPVLVPITNMILIKPGSFQRQRNLITLTREFWIGKYEVTQAEYLVLTGKNPSHFRGSTNAPVEKISFLDAAGYCAALSERERQAGRLPKEFEYRLPTEAEWEYACRAGTTNFFSFGNDQNLAEKYAWTSENSERKPHPVGLKEPNPWGLHDMHGNVWEWVSDWFAPYPEMDLVNPIGPPESKFKVFRGGGWNQDAEFARSGNRFMMSPTNGIHFVGFRVALGQRSGP